MTFTITTTGLPPTILSAVGPSAPQDFTDTKGLAKHYKLCERKVHRLREDGILPYYEISERCFRYKIAECDEAMKRFRHKGLAG